MQGGDPEEIILGVVEESACEGTECVDDLRHAVSDELCEGGAMEIVVKQTGGVGECGGMLGEIAEEGDGGGVGGGGGLEDEGKFGGEEVDVSEEGVDIGLDEVERCGVVVAEVVVNVEGGEEGEMEVGHD